MSSLFQRLQRYQRTPGRNAREDRLTEALAVTLEGAPDAARHLVELHFGVSPEAGAEVATQVRHPGLRVDLELCFGPPRLPELVVWFEAKVDSPAHRKQGERYMEALRRDAPERWKFTWLTRGECGVEGGVPDDAKRLTWQELGGSLREWLREPGRSLDKHGPRLVSEFLDHLEREERLAFTERLGQEDATALGGYEVARGRLDELLRQAKILLEQEWGRPQPQGGESWPQRRSPQLPDFHLVLQRGRRSSGPSWPQDSWFEWHGRRDDAREHPDGSWVLGSGATFRASDAPNEAEYTEWFERNSVAEFEYGQGGWENGYRYIFRYLTLEELVERCDGPDVGAQARKLADWVTETFDVLNAKGPPPRADAAERHERAGPAGGV